MLIVLVTNLLLNPFTLHQKTILIRALELRETHSKMRGGMPLHLPIGAI